MIAMVSLYPFQKIYITHIGLKGVWLVIFSFNLILHHNWSLLLLFTK
jgi:hypothetical protein